MDFYTRSILLTLFLGAFSFSFSQTPNFEAQTLDDNVQIGYGLAIGDVDGDGKDDILMADKKAFVWYRNPDWKRFVLAENLTERDNVCIAAKDIDGDGKVEVAVGGQWNPGETNDFNRSGSVHYLIRPDDPTEQWEAVALPHVPTIHRMRWVKVGRKTHELVVLPLHGIRNKRGEGPGVKVLSFRVPKDPRGSWNYRVLDEDMHMTHNFDVSDRYAPKRYALFIGSKEGIQLITGENQRWEAEHEWLVEDHGFGEIRVGRNLGGNFLAGIEPMHGNVLSVYHPSEGKKYRRTVLTDDLKQGHALACADLVDMGEDQVVVGWREANEAGKVGIRLYVPLKDGSWEKHIIDDNEMACEDLKVADLNGDEKLDIIACGRATQNLKIYWNRSE